MRSKMAFLGLLVAGAFFILPGTVRALEESATQAPQQEEVMVAQVTTAPASVPEASSPAQQVVTESLESHDGVIRKGEITLQDGTTIVVKQASSDLNMMASSPVTLLQVVISGKLVAVEPDESSRVAGGLPTRYIIETASRKGVVDLDHLTGKDGKTVLVKLNHTLMWQGSEGGEFIIN